jgi:predicted CoA-substrate-specific enzyme activase
LISAGIDLGSRTTKLVVVEQGRLIDFRITDSGTDPLQRAHGLLEGVTRDRLMATGYGRHLVRESLGCPTITEIKAYALGAQFLFPGARTVIDIGGQDSKAIRVRNGAVEEFEMNDRCAAGTGRFLEVMAHTLGFALDDFANKAMEASSAASISSMCTVFAESEVVTLLAKGESPESIALGLHKSIIFRLHSLLGRVGFEPPVVFAGGVARNKCMVTLLQERLQMPLLVPEQPQCVGALGAALA